MSGDETSGGKYSPVAGDPLSGQLDRVAMLLEGAGYAIEVDYTALTIIVWLEEWPLLIAVRRQRFQ